MSYKDQLYPWCIVRLLPNMQRCVVCRLRNRSDAEGHLQILPRLMPHLTFIIIFDLTPEPNDPATQQKSSSPK